MGKIAKNFDSLKSCFLRKDWLDKRFQQLYEWITNPLLEAYLLFQTLTL